MKQININDRNEFDERARSFFESNKAKRLSQKYREKSYEERFSPVYYIALVISFFCNGVSIITASSFVFAYLFSIVYALPEPYIISAMITGIILITIEVLQRIFGPCFFQSWLQYGKLSLLGALVVLSLISVTLSYLGSPDFIELVSNKPGYAAPELLDVDEIKAGYNAQIQQAKEEAEEYKKRKLWGGRLSDDNATVYQSLLENVAKLRDNLNEKVDQTEEKNQKLKAESVRIYKEELAKYESSISNRGTGLGLIAIIAQIIFYLSIWYMEYYDFRVASQYASYYQSQNNTTNEDIDTVLENGVKKN